MLGGSHRAKVSFLMPACSAPARPEQEPTAEFGALQILVDCLRGGAVQADGAWFVAFSRRVKASFVSYFGRFTDPGGNKSA